MVILSIKDLRDGKNLDSFGENLDREEIKNLARYYIENTPQYFPSNTEEAKL